jgi:putative FmdB family regulatory protein
MPLYEYECDACGRRFEVIQKFSDAPIDTCEKCGGAVRKLLSSPAIQFKGSGWYITDYARAGKSDKTESGGSSASTGGAAASGSAGDTKTETKTEAKADTKSDAKKAPKPAATSS